MAAAERAAETLPELFTRLADQLTQLLDAKLALLRVELKEEFNTYLRSIGMLVAGAVIALIGFSLLNVAIAFFISMLFNGVPMSQPARYGLGFIVAAALYLVAGTVMVMKARHKMARQKIVPPRTAAELRRDKEWLQRQNET